MKGGVSETWTSSYQPAGSASLLLKGTGSEGELGWFGQFCGFLLLSLFGGLVCLFGLNGFSLLPAGALP